MKIINDWQKKKFVKRRREEEPEQQTEKIINDNYLKTIYLEHLNHMLGVHKSIDNQSALKILEIGGAGGITQVYFPHVEVTDLRKSKYISKIVDAQKLPYKKSSINLILAKDVLHHLPNVTEHFKEIERVLKNGGKVVYLEPNWNLCSRLIFTLFHPEPYIRSMKDWQFISNDPMDANQALSWIIFSRDSEEWNRKFPHLTFEIGKSTNGIDFLLSGGVYFRNKVNSFFLLHLRKFRIFGLFDTSRFIVVTKI